MERKPGVFWRENPDFIKELADYLEGKSVLEIFAGNGYLASLLQARNIQVTPTSLKVGYDFDLYYTDVTELMASDAVEELGKNYDVLLVTWPTVTIDAYNALLQWSRLYNKPIVYIGETTDLAINQLGGCATDELWNNAEFIKHFSTYQGNLLEKAGILKLSNTEELS